MDLRLYSRSSRTGDIFIAKTIENVFVSARHTNDIYYTRSNVSKKCTLKDFGEPTNFLRWTITNLRNNESQICQLVLIAKLLQSTSLHCSKPCTSLLLTSSGFDEHNDSPRLSTNETKLVQPLLGDYRYLANNFRPDIACEYSCLALHARLPCYQHIILLKKYFTISISYENARLILLTWLTQTHPGSIQPRNSCRRWGS